MAAGTKLVIAFNTSEGDTAQFTFNYGKPGAGATNVKALAQAMITNTQIYEKTLIGVKTAKEVTTSETIYDMDNLTARTIDMNPDVGTTDENTLLNEKVIQMQ